MANELLILVAESLKQKDLNYLLQANRHLAGLLTPLLHEFAVEDKDGLTALQWASGKGYEPLAKIVLSRGADVNARNPSDGKMPLHFAAGGGHEEVVRLLVENRADVGAADGAIVRVPLWPGRTSRSEGDGWGREFGNTALHYAAERGAAGIVSALLDAGADVNAFDKGGQSALHEAARRGHVAVVKVLLDNGADIEGQGHEGEKPVQSAIDGRNEAVVWLLIDHGAAVNAIDRRSDTVLHYAAGEGMESVVKLLIQKGGDVLAVDDNIQTVLHRAALGGNPAVVKILLKSGVDPEAIDKFGCTALDVAKRHHGKHREVVWLLLNSERDRERDLEGEGASRVCSGGESSGGNTWSKRVHTPPN
jgi:ankyrin repeat protein